MEGTEIMSHEEFAKKLPTSDNSIENILEDARKIIYGDREQTYGNPAKNLELIAQYWSAHLNSAKNTNISLTYSDVCVMMVLLKAARLANSPDHRDSLIDICGYAALSERCQKFFAEGIKKLKDSFAEKVK